MERLLHYVWKYKLYDAGSLMTSDGTPLQVLDPGMHNTNAGPDFFNAKIKVNNTVWAGSVEIHDKASDWLRHNHHTDPAYDSVILHVTGCNDADVYRLNGERIPQMLLTIPEPVRANIDWLLHQDITMPCLPFIREMDSLHILHWMDLLLEERLARKSADIFTLLEQYGKDWNEVFYILLTRSFGFGVNSDAFEWLARSLPFVYIQKHRNQLIQVEALLFGQAGMLEESGSCAYYRQLQKEYKFLQHKFGLKPLEASLFKSLRLRPGNFPHQRLAQLAAIWHTNGTLFSRMINEPDPKEIASLLCLPLSDYWTTHYHFRYSSSPQEKRLGEYSLHILMINAVVPILFAYGKYLGEESLCERAIGLLESLPPEKNSIVQAFARSGIEVAHAGETQALIQLRRAYCDQKKCLYCHIGFRFLKRNT